MEKEKSHLATVKRIVPAFQLGYGYEGEQAVAIVSERLTINGERARRDAWYPIESGQNFEKGQRIRVTPEVDRDEASGGSITRYRLTPVAS